MTDYFSHSRVSAYHTCPQKHHLAYERRLALSRDDRPYLKKGILVHVGMAAALRRHFYVPKSSLEEYQDAAEHALRTEAATILDGANVTIIIEGVAAVDEDWISKHHELVEESVMVVRNAVKEMILPDWEVLIDRKGEPLIEWDFQYTSYGVPIQGRLDAVLKRRSSGQVYVVDFKTFGEKPTTWEDMILGSQLPIYIAAVRQLTSHVPTMGMLWQIRANGPRKPKFNKDGSASRAKNIITNWTTYKEALVEAGLDPADYQDMKEALEERRFNEPTWAFYSDEMLNNVLWPFLRAAMEIQIAPSKRMVLGFPCKLCPFKQWCLAEVSGQDPEELVGELYVYKDRAEEAEENEDA